MNPHSLPFNVQSLVDGVHAVPFHVCVNVDTVAVAWSILNVVQFTIWVLLTHVLPTLWYQVSQLSNAYLTVHVVHVLLLTVYGVHCVLHTQWSGQTVSGYVVLEHDTPLVVQLCCV